jgi:hypothetical protein
LQPVATAPGSVLVDPSAVFYLRRDGPIERFVYRRLKPVATAPGSEFVWRRNLGFAPALVRFGP